jgi:hypothetical protein
VAVSLLAIGIEEDLGSHPQRYLSATSIKLIICAASRANVSIDVEMHWDFKGQRLTHVCGKLLEDHGNTIACRHELKIILRALVEDGHIHWDAKGFTICHLLDNDTVGSSHTLQRYAARIVKKHLASFENLHPNLLAFVKMH